MCVEPIRVLHSDLDDPPHAAKGPPHHGLRDFNAEHRRDRDGCNLLRTQRLPRARARACSLNAALLLRRLMRIPSTRLFPERPRARACSLTAARLFRRVVRISSTPPPGHMPTPSALKHGRLVRGSLVQRITIFLLRGDLLFLVSLGLNAVHRGLKFQGFLAAEGASDFRKVEGDARAMLLAAHIMSNSSSTSSSGMSSAPSSSFTGSFGSTTSAFSASSSSFSGISAFSSAAPSGTYSNVASVLRSTSASQDQSSGSRRASSSGVGNLITGFPP
mmetsp:Transcript_10770/g.32681  ORF Transcript_10770/g.32681 Transcript_10770/m.32681 type:complete len:275 (+) Transcript_10770:1169-1993(+)